jgi:hypothetical protein
MNPYMDVQDPQEPQEEDMTIRTRSGYAVADAVRGFRVALEQSGATAAGKSLHYTADLVCSGCFELWQKILWEYCIDHIGIGSPRIFWFLKQRFADLETAWAKLPAEAFYKTVEYQKVMAEVLLIVRSQARRPGLKMPKVPPESHNEEWVRGATREAPSSAAVGRVFKGNQDLAVLRRVGDEFAKACADGATEKAFWWLKWCFEEDARMRRDGGGSLSTLDRGPIGWGAKQRSHVGFYLAAVLTEIYKELIPKFNLRMNEEFIALLQLYSLPNKRLSASRRMQLLCLAIQIVCEVPRWKVPAAPALVKDPVALERAVGHAESFFREVLAYDAPMGDVQKAAKKGSSKSLVAGGPSGRTMNAKQLRDMNVNQHLQSNDDIINSWLNGKL